MEPQMHNSQAMPNETHMCFEAEWQQKGQENSMGFLLKITSETQNRRVIHIQWQLLCVNTVLFIKVIFLNYYLKWNEACFETDFPLSSVLHAQSGNS